MNGGIKIIDSCGSVNKLRTGGMSVLFRMISTFLLSLVIGSITLVMGTVIHVLFVSRTLSMNDLIPSFVSFSFSFVLVLCLHCRIHDVFCIYKFFCIYGALGVGGGVVLYALGNALNDTHVSTGLLSNFGYELMVAAGIGVVILGLILIASGGFGYLSRVKIEMVKAKEWWKIARDR